MARYHPHHSYRYIYINVLKFYILQRAEASQLHVPFVLFPVQEQSLNSLDFSSTVSHRDEDIQVETIVGLPEEEDKDEAEEARTGYTPVQPRQVCMRQKTERQIR
ncbi:hypothetical protein XENORESO_010561 [Xenotaenia resolanae]|uniref:Uncharacterized protein n=1 Tax=Xenotaenia resolanae TaxID=208358 RepID=A0ABV0WQH4_9TELE